MTFTTFIFKSGKLIFKHKSDFTVFYGFLFISFSDCGISMFYTHRESRGRGGVINDSFELFKYGNKSHLSAKSSRRNGKLLDSGKSKKSSRRGRSRSRRALRDAGIEQPLTRNFRSRANSRAMKWKNRNPADLGGPLARIVGGAIAQPYAWPWQISLQLKHPTMGFIGHWW